MWFFAARTVFAAALFGLDSPAQVAEFTKRLARQLSDPDVN